MSVVLSIVIPTYNRYRYLFECLKVLLSFESDQFEVVVQDNSEDNSEIKRFIKDCSDERLRYYHDASRHYSQTENSEIAVEKARGKYVCYIGDDDMVSRRIVDFALWMDANEIDSLLFPGAPYYWPDVEFLHGARPVFSIYSFSGALHVVDPLIEYKLCASFGASEINDMPRLYHGIVSRKSLHAAKKKAGCFFPGPSPDMASCVALSHSVERQVKIDLPLLIDGFSYKSAGGKSLRGKHKARLEDVDQLPDNILMSWNDRVPRIWLGETIYAQSFFEASSSMNLPDIINYRDLYISILTRHPECAKYVFSCNRDGDNITLLLKSTIAFLARVRKYVKRRISRGKSIHAVFTTTYEGFSILDAERELSNRIHMQTTRLLSSDQAMK